MPKGIPGSRRSPEETREYMRKYMKNRRGGPKQRRSSTGNMPPEGPHSAQHSPEQLGARGNYDRPRAFVADKAAYDPRRDGAIFHTDRAAEFCGDPLPGRSALDCLRSAPVRSEPDPADLPIKSISAAGAAYRAPEAAESGEDELDAAE